MQNTKKEKRGQAVLLRAVISANLKVSFCHCCWEWLQPQLEKLFYWLEGPNGAFLIGPGWQPQGHIPENCTHFPLWTYWACPSE